ncbi:MAG: hypothetical protein DRP00_05555 [Candidatus Aenigmatarchaeota archaeon]|nr:MAG: hypothetical protein DRP00_05555 [Candidatus Aenigmarchaeota archaeon]
MNNFLKLHKLLHYFGFKKYMKHLYPDMTEADIHRLFEDYYRGDKYLKEKNKKEVINNEN